MDKPPVRTFRSSRWAVGLVAVALLLFAAGLLWFYRTEGLSLKTITFMGLTLFGIAGLIDAITQRIELHDDRIVLVQNLRKRQYARRLFVKATWAKGVPVSLQTTSGEWVSLPGVGASSQGLVNTLRAWIKKSS
jgi:hypothetical protein